MKYMSRAGKALDEFVKKDQEKHPFDKPSFVDIALGLGNRQMLTPYQRGLRAKGKMTNITGI